MQSRHIIARAADAAYEEPEIYRGHSEGFTSWTLANDSHPAAVHTGFGICRPESGGTIGSHVHSFEESFLVPAGEVVCETPGGSVTLREGHYGCVPMGLAHRCRNA